MCERCFGQQTNLDRHLKKHEADDGTVNSVADSADSSNENDRDEPSTYFDEIRSFMGKVTYGGEATYSHLAQHHPAYFPNRLKVLHQMPVTKYDDEDSDDEAEGKQSPSETRYDIKMAEKCELLNNNTAEPVIEIST